MKTYLKIVLLSLLPVILVYIGKSVSSAEWLQDKIGIFPGTEVADLMSVSFFVGIFFSGLIIPTRLAYAVEKNRKIKDNYLKTLENKKKIFVEAIKSEVGQQNIHLNIRIFTKRKGLCAWINGLFRGKIEFEIRNIPGLANIGNTDGLKFEVKPKKQGIVGYVYDERSMIYDDELESSNTKEIYNLTDFQMEKTSGTKFALGVPLFDKKSNVEVIIAMDSDDQIKIDEENEGKWHLMATRYCQAMHHCIPILVN
ncbi:hypothetical protein E9993_22410 [Labilibacter sediminis]|nr:hypothetical protein E9993_22410 [Labilibacter sediminis]